MKEYNFKDDFEMLYLRHDYLNKIKSVNEKDVKKFMNVASITGRMMYDKYKPHFDKVGFMSEDVSAISQVYLVSYIGLYSLKNNKQIFDRYLEKYRERNGQDSFPTDAEVEQREKNCLINFLRQKLHHCSILCARKARNIVVGKDIRLAIAETKDSQPFSSILISDYRASGYRKVTKKELKEAKIRAREAGLPVLTDEKGYKIIEIEIGSKPMTPGEYGQIFTTAKDMYDTTPEQTLINHEKEVELVDIKKHFNDLQPSQKRGVLLRFIETYKDRDLYKNEVSIARKMLKNLKNVV